jgi:ABC-type amino acid transport system permease subunit
MSNKYKSPGQESGEPPENRSLQQYQTIAGLLEYENAAYWTRATIFSATQTAFIGFIMNLLSNSPTNPPRIAVTCLMASVLGIPTIAIYILIMLQSHRWIDHWTIQLKSLEPAAFGPINVLRNGPRTGIKQLMLTAMGIFFIAWLVVLSYSSYLIGKY